MKLRLEKESVKVRLSSLEIDMLNRENSIQETIKISDQNLFKFDINLTEGVEICHVNFGENSISINIPTNKVSDWVNSNQIGIREVINTDTGNLMLVVEEDLQPRRMKNIEENHATKG